MKSSLTSSAAAKIAVCGLAATGVLALSGTAFAAATPGTVTPTVSGSSALPNGPYPAGPNNPNGDTPFQLSVPNPTDCPGDTATGNYHVDTFIIPASADPGLVTYSNGQPVVTTATGTTQYAPIITQNGSQYTLINTAQTTGQILEPLPNFDFTRNFNTTSRGTASLYPTGTYSLGLACVDGNGVTQSYFSTQVAFDQGAGTFTFLAPTGPGSVVPEAPLAIGLPLGALGLIGGAVLLQRRRKAVESV